MSPNARTARLKQYKAADMAIRMTGGPGVVACLLLVEDDGSGSSLSIPSSTIPVASPSSFFSGTRQNLPIIVIIIIMNKKAKVIVMHG